MSAAWGGQRTRDARGSGIEDEASGAIDADAEERDYE
jgi:hypothetical protein